MPSRAHARAAADVGAGRQEGSAASGGARHAFDVDGVFGRPLPGGRGQCIPAPGKGSWRTGSSERRTGLRSAAVLSGT